MKGKKVEKKGRNSSSFNAQPESRQWRLHPVIPDRILGKLGWNLFRAVSRLNNPARHLLKRPLEPVTRTAGLEKASHRRLPHRESQTRFQRTVLTHMGLFVFQSSPASVNEGTPPAGFNAPSASVDEAKHTPDDSKSRYIR